MNVTGTKYVDALPLLVRKLRVLSDRGTGRRRTEEQTLAAWLRPPGIIPASVCSESNLCSLLGGDGVFSDANAESATPSAAPLLLVFRGAAIVEVR